MLGSAYAALVFWIQKGKKMQQGTEGLLRQAGSRKGQYIQILGLFCFCREMLRTRFHNSLGKICLYEFLVVPLFWIYCYTKVSDEYFWQILRAADALWRALCVSDHSEYREIEHISHKILILSFETG